jgi:polysaccharide pyruvyl transferase WcaK-like protein
LTESQAKAQKAAVEAKFAESGAVLDLQKKGWDITKIQEDIKIAKQNASIAAMNAQIAREGNQIKREENQLKLADMVQKRDSAVREKAADLESARTNMDNMLNTADRILKTPIGVIGSAAGPVSSRMPTLIQDTADFEALVDTLGSQAFLSQIPNIKGLGSLSNDEGKKLQASLQNFSLSQSPERLLENVREAQRLIMKARKNMTARSGLPETIPDTPAVSTSGSDIDALVKKYTQGGR